MKVSGIERLARLPFERNRSNDKKSRKIRMLEQVQKSINFCETCSSRRRPCRSRRGGGKLSAAAPAATYAPDPSRGTDAKAS